MMVASEIMIDIANFTFLMMMLLVIVLTECSSVKAQSSLYTKIGNDAVNDSTCMAFNSFGYDDKFTLSIYSSILPVTVLTLQGSTEFTESWFPLIVGLIAFMVVAFTSFLIGRSKASTGKMNGHIEQKIVSITCSIGFVIGGLLVQVSASALYIGLAVGDINGIISSTIVLIWGLIVFSNGIIGYYQKTRILGALTIIAGVLVTFILALDAWGSFLGFRPFISEFFSLASTSLSVGELPILLFLGLSSISIVTGISTVYPISIGEHEKLEKREKEVIPKKPISVGHKSPRPRRQKRYYPKNLSDIMIWLNGGDWDKVMGFDLLAFTKNVKSEDAFLDRLENERENREDWCEKKGMLSSKVKSSITESYHSIKSGRRNILYVKRIAEQIFYEWALNKKSDEEITKSCLSRLIKTYINDTTEPWKNPNLDELKKDIIEKIMDQNSLEIGIYLSKEKRKTESIRFLEDAVKRKFDNDPQKALANHWLGTTLFELKQYYKSIAYLKTATTLRTVPDDYSWLVSAYVWENDFNSALPYAEKLVKELGSTNAVDFYNMAVILLKLGRHLDARQYAIRAAVIDPNEPKYKELLSALSQYLGRGLY